MDEPNWGSVSNGGTISRTRNNAIAATITDGTAIADDMDWSDDIVYQCCIRWNCRLAMVMNVVPNETYDFTLYPYTNFGTSIDYKTDATPASVQVNSPVVTSCPAQLTYKYTDSHRSGCMWTTGGSSTWQIEYGPAGFTQGAGAKETVIQTLLD